MKGGNQYSASVRSSASMPLNLDGFGPGVGGGEARGSYDTLGRVSRVPRAARGSNMGHGNDGDIMIVMEGLGDEEEGGGGGEGGGEEEGAEDAMSKLMEAYAHGVVYYMGKSVVKMRVRIGKEKGE